MLGLFFRACLGGRFSDLSGHNISDRSDDRVVQGGWLRCRQVCVDRSLSAIRSGFRTLTSFLPCENRQYWCDNLLGLLSTGGDEDTVKLAGEGGNNRNEADDKN